MAPQGRIPRTIAGKFGGAEPPGLNRGKCEFGSSVKDSFADLNNNAPQHVLRNCRYYLTALMLFEWHRTESVGCTVT